MNDRISWCVQASVSQRRPRDVACAGSYVQDCERIFRRTRRRLWRASADALQGCLVSCGRRARCASGSKGREQAQSVPLCAILRPTLAKRRKSGPNGRPNFDLFMGLWSGVLALNSTQKCIFACRPCGVVGKAPTRGDARPTAIFYYPRAASAGPNDLKFGLSALPLG